MANKLREITFEHLTEACPQARRRLMAGAAAELACWLTMEATRCRAQLESMPQATDPQTQKWSDQMRAWLAGKISLANTLIGQVFDRFSVHEWNAAVEHVDRLMKVALAGGADLTEGVVDPATHEEEPYAD